MGETQGIREVWGASPDWTGCDQFERPGELQKTQLWPHGPKGQREVMAQDIWKSLVKRKFPAPEHCTERARPRVVPRDANFKVGPRIMRCPFSLHSLVLGASLLFPKIQLYTQEMTLQGWVCTSLPPPTYASHPPRGLPPGLEMHSAPVNLCSLSSSPARSVIK